MDVKRMRYFNGLFLKADEFILDQDYHIRMRRLHNRHLHTWGIVWGLKVVAGPGARQVTVEEGMALNRVNVRGEEVSQEIVLDADRPVDLSGYAANDAVYISIAYAESEADLVPEKGGPTKIHWHENAALGHAKTKPVAANENLILARVTLKADGTVDATSIAFEEAGRPLRTLAGIAGGTLEAAKLTLTIEGVTAGLAFLEGRVIEGQNGIQVVSPRTTLTGTLTVGGQVRGGSLAFVDAAGALFPDGWLGMANNIDAATKWLHIGGIRDGTVRRLALVADRTMISGSLGLGTPTPAGRLQISGPLPSIYLVGNTTANEDGLRVHYNETFGQRTGVIDVKGLSLRLRGESGAGGFGATERLFIDLTTGNVGIGTLNPSDRLDVEGHIRLNNWNLWLRGGADLNHGLGWFGLGKLFAGVNVDGPALFGASGGALGTTNGGQAMALQWNTAGDATIRGNVGTHGFSPAPRTPGWGGGIHTWDIEAEGTTWSRSGYQSGARDLAENCVSDEDLAPGDVVCVGATDAVRRSRTRDDVAVLGVVSTAPGVLLNATRDHCAAKVFPIALCGRVPCKVTDENGAIAVGDLLTTSSVAGHAMKAEPIVVEGERLFRPGTIIGKALDALASGRGVIDVFVLPA